MLFDLEAVDDEGVCSGFDCQRYCITFQKKLITLNYYLFKGHRLLRMAGITALAYTSFRITHIHSQRDFKPDIIHFWLFNTGCHGGAVGELLPYIARNPGAILTTCAVCIEFVHFPCDHVGIFRVF